MKCRQQQNDLARSIVMITQGHGVNVRFSHEQICVTSHLGLILINKSVNNKSVLDKMDRKCYTQ